MIPDTRRSWSTPWQALALVVRGATARTAVPVAAVVGIILSAANEGGALFSGRAGAITWLRVAFNFLVPFLVASAGYLVPLRRPH